MAQNISNDGIMNLLVAMCDLAHEDLAPKQYTLNLTKKRAYLDMMNKYRNDKENAFTAAQWLEYMKDVFVG